MEKTILKNIAIGSVVSVSCIGLIGVVIAIMLVLCVFIYGERVDELWFVIAPEENVETGFTKEDEFLAYLADNGIENPDLTDVNELYEELVNKGYLEWFPDEYKE